jgi:hypothetical protein
VQVHGPPSQPPSDLKGLKPTRSPVCSSCVRSSKQWAQSGQEHQEPHQQQWGRCCWLRHPYTSRLQQNQWKKDDGNGSLYSRKLNEEELVRRKASTWVWEKLTFCRSGSRLTGWKDSKSWRDSHWKERFRLVWNFVTTITAARNNIQKWKSDGQRICNAVNKKLHHYVRHSSTVKVETSAGVNISWPYLRPRKFIPSGILLDTSSLPAPKLDCRNTHPADCCSLGQPRNFIPPEISTFTVFKIKPEVNTQIAALFYIPLIIVDRGN